MRSPYWGSYAVLIWAISFQRQAGDFLMANKPTYQELERRVKELEKESLECMHYFRSMLSHIKDDVLIIDRDYRVTDVNKIFLVTLGRTREDVIGRNWHEITHGGNEPCETNEEVCMLKKVFETGRSCSFWHPHLHAEGWKAWVDILLSPLRNGKGEITHVVEAMRDMTDLVKAGKVQQRRDEKYRRLVAVGQG